jgi:hypothetical protein
MYEGDNGHPNRSPNSPVSYTSRVQNPATTNVDYRDTAPSTRPTHVGAVRSVTIGGTPYDVNVLLDTAGKHSAIAAVQCDTATTAASTTSTAPLKVCPSFKNVSFFGNGCRADPPNSCPHIHLASQLAVGVRGEQPMPPSRCGYQLYYQHDKIHLGVHSKDVRCNGHLQSLSGYLKRMSDIEIGDALMIPAAVLGAAAAVANSSLISPSLEGATMSTPLLYSNPTTTIEEEEEVVIAIDPIQTRLRDDAFSCKLVVPAQQNGGVNKQVLAFTSYTPNFVDQGIEMGKLDAATLSRASRLFVSHYFHGKPVKLWGDWAKGISLSTEFSTSAIAATKYYDVKISKAEGGVDTVSVTGESDVQPEEPLRVVNVKLSHTIDYEASHHVIRRSMPDTTATTITTSEYFKLPSSSSRMEYSLVLAGAVAGWCLKKPSAYHDGEEEEGSTTPNEGPSNVSACVNADCCYGVRLSITLRGYSELSSEPFGHNVVSVVSDLIGKVCYKRVDPSLAACTVRRHRPNEEQPDSCVPSSLGRRRANRMARLQRHHHSPVILPPHTKRWLHCWLCSDIRQGMLSGRSDVIWPRNMCGCLIAQQRSGSAAQNPSDGSSPATTSSLCLTPSTQTVLLPSSG